MARVPSKGRTDRERRRSERAEVVAKRPELAEKTLEVDKQAALGADYSTDLRGTTQDILRRCQKSEEGGFISAYTTCVCLLLFPF